MRIMARWERLLPSLPWWIKLISCESFLSWRPVEGTECPQPGPLSSCVRPRRIPLAYWLLVWYWLPITHSLTIYRCSLCCCSSTLTDRPKWIFFHGFLTTTKTLSGTEFLKFLIYTSFRTCTPVPPQWLIRAGSRYYDLELFPECDAKDEITEVK